MVAKQTRNKLKGTLNYDPYDGIELRLMGNLRENESEVNSQFEIVNGLTVNGKQITLLNGMRNNLQENYPGIPTIQIIFQEIFIGKNFSQCKEIYFNKVSVKLNNLDSWVGINGFKPTTQDKSKGYSINYEVPQNIDFRINEVFKGKFSFKYHTSKQVVPIFKSSIEQDVYLEIETEKNTKAKYIDFMDVIYRFKMFLTLASYKEIFYHEVNYFSDELVYHFNDLIIPIPVEYFNNSMIRSDYKFQKSDSLFVFSYFDVRNYFPQIIVNWYNLQAEIKILVDLFGEVLYQNKHFDENAFLNVARALETFHRKFFTNDNETTEKHKIRIKSVIGSVEEEYKEWLKEKLAFSHEPTFKERMKKLIADYSTSTLLIVVDDIELFIKNIADSRNYYTHFDNRLKEKALKGGELYYLTEKMKILLLCCLLIKAGFPIELLDNLLKEHEWVFFNHILPESVE